MTETEHAIRAGLAAVAAAHGLTVHVARAETGWTVEALHPTRGNAMRLLGATPTTTDISDTAAHIAAWIETPAEPE